MALLWRRRSLIVIVGFLHVWLHVMAEVTQVNEAEPSTTHRPPSCFSPAKVLCLMARNCTDGLHDALFPSGPTAKKLTYDRVRFPGTASSDERRMMKQFEGTDAYGRYRNLTVREGGCSSPNARLCFAPSDVDGVGVDVDLAFRSVKNPNAGVHGPFDVVETMMSRSAAAAAGGGDDGSSSLHSRVLLTTLREPLSYATKFYRFRNTWDKTLDLSNYTFDKWADRGAPWRTNFLTRSLGAESDRRSAPITMIHNVRGKVEDKSWDLETFLADEYMTEQNALGPEQSSVYRLALDRLRNSFVHFGLFHRLPESRELLAHAFCWDLVEWKYFDKANVRGMDALEQFAETYEKKEFDLEKAARRLRERNRLDLALMEEAEKIMDERLETMRAEKARGVLCNFLGKIEVTCEGASASTDEL